VVNADSLDTWVIPALAQTDFLFDIIVADETVSADHLRYGDASAAVSTQARPVQGCDVFPLGAMRYVATCTPAFFERYFADGVTRDALATAPMLDFSGVDQLQRSWIKTMAGQALTPPTHLLPSTRGFVEACLCGLGWALNPAPLIAPHMASGRLVALAADQPQDVWLHWQVRSLVAPSLAPLTRALRRAARTSLVPPNSP
jgi:LysR family transcriptional regulator (chromosome initiation inhibitor)